MDIMKFWNNVFAYARARILNSISLYGKCELDRSSRVSQIKYQTDTAPFVYSKLVTYKLVRYCIKRML